MNEVKVIRSGYEENDPRYKIMILFRGGENGVAVSRKEYVTKEEAQKAIDNNHALEWELI